MKKMRLFSLIWAKKMDKIKIVDEDDIILARQKVRLIADMMGYSILNKTRLATAVSELARNVFVHGGGGYMEYGQIELGGEEGITCIFIDQGAGIANIPQAMNDGFTTVGSLGRGLPGTKRLVDEFNVTSEVGKGTKVEITKWK